MNSLKLGESVGFLNDYQLMTTIISLLLLSVATVFLVIVSRKASVTISTKAGSCNLHIPVVFQISCIPNLINKPTKHGI